MTPNEIIVALRAHFPRDRCYAMLTDGWGQRIARRFSPQIRCRNCVTWKTTNCTPEHKSTREGREVCESKLISFQHASRDLFESFDREEPWLPDSTSVVCESSSIKFSIVHQSRVMSYALPIRGNFLLLLKSRRAVGRLLLEDVHIRTSLRDLARAKLFNISWSKTEARNTAVKGSM